MAVVRVFRTRGLPILRQLMIEEALLRAHDGNWLVLNDGCRDPAVVLGISGQPEALVHTADARAAGVQLIKRFSGGGTVVVDSNTVFSTLIFQQQALPEVPAFPQPIMEFTGDLYGDVFATLERDPARVPRTARSAASDRATQFQLRQNDYTWGERKVGGNAQAITKFRWLHHTSFLWEYRRDRMALLKEPSKRPEYRGERTHRAFLCPLASLGFHRQEFLEGIEDAMVARGFELQLASAEEVEDVLERDHLRITKLLE